MLGLPAESHVSYVTGATMGNFTALAAARDALLRRAGHDPLIAGLWNAPRLRVVTGDEVHVTVVKALTLLGFGSAEIERVPTDDQGPPLRTTRPVPRSPPTPAHPGGGLMQPAEPTPPVTGRTEAVRLVLISGFACQYADDHGWMRGRYTDEHLRAADAAAEAVLGRDTLEALSALCTAEHWSSDDMMLAAATVDGPATLLARLDAPASRSGHSLRDVAQAINDHGVHAEVVTTGGNSHSVSIPTGYCEILVNDAAGPLSSGDEPVEGIVATGHLTVDDDLVPWRCTELDPTGECGDGAFYESRTRRCATSTRPSRQSSTPPSRPCTRAGNPRSDQAWQDDDQAAWDTTSTHVSTALSMSLDEAAHEVAAFVAEAT